MPRMVLFDPIRDAVRRLIRSPTGELTRAQRFARFALDLTRHCAGELTRNRAAQMASALTYRTLFSLVPTVILAMLMFRAFVGVEVAQTRFQDTVYKFLGLSAVALPDGEPIAPGEDAVVEETAVHLETWRATADEHLGDIVNQAWEHLKFGTIGPIGILLLIWAALALAVTVEQCFNHIYRCPSGRAWHHRIPIYWGVITLGPLLLFVSLYTAGSVVHWAEDALDLSAVLRVTGRAAGLLASWLLLFFTYLLMPNARVNLRPALIGSFVAASLWEVAKWGFKLYVAKAVGMSAIYGSLGMIPLFLFWLYLTWLIVLFGLQLTYTLQAMHGRKFEIEELQQRQRHVLGDPRWVIGMMSVVGRAFARGHPITQEQISRELLIDTLTVSNIGEALEEAGLLHRLDASGHHHGGFSLAISPDQIRIADLLNLGRTLAKTQMGPETAPTQALLERLDAAQRDAAGDGSLADVLFDHHAVDTSKPAPSEGT